MINMFQDFLGIETIMYNILENSLDSATISMVSPNDKSIIFDTSISQNKNTKVSVKMDGKIPIIKIDIFLDGKILSSSTKNESTSEHDLKDIERALNSKINFEMSKYLKHITRNYNSDINGFLGFLSRNYLDLDSMKNIDWNTSFKKSKFIINTSVTLGSNHLYPRY